MQQSQVPVGCRVGASDRAVKSPNHWFRNEKCEIISKGNRATRLEMAGRALVVETIVA